MKPGLKPAHFRVTSDGTADGTRVYYYRPGATPVELRGILSASWIVGGAQRPELLLRVRAAELDIEVQDSGAKIVLSDPTRPE